MNPEKGLRSRTVHREVSLVSSIEVVVRGNECNKSESLGCMVLKTEREREREDDGGV